MKIFNANWNNPIATALVIIQSDVMSAACLVVLRRSCKNPHPITGGLKKFVRNEDFLYF